MPSYVVQGRDPRRIATAVVLYQLLQPRFALTLVAVLAAFAIAGAFSGPSGSFGGVVIALVVIVFVTEFKRRQLARQLARRGFRPGSTLDAAADDDGLTITAFGGSASHRWDQVEHTRVVRRVVLFRLAAARFVVAVPREALPDGVLERLGRP